MGRPAALALLVVLPFLGIWYFGATAYLVFHDQLLASLISRQADMQYSYEDRIAVLRSQLERQTSRALVDRQTLSTTIRDLATRGDRLEAHAAAIDALVRGAGTGTIISNAGGRNDGARFDNPLLTPSPAPLPNGANAYDAATPSSALRLDQTGDRGVESESEPRRDKHVELLPEQQGENLAALFAKIETRQAEDLARLRDPMLRAIERIQTALAATGLPSSRWKASSEGVGGPFVPLSADATALTFEQNLALLQGAVAQHRRLAELIDQVPLHRPLQGRLEITSPFGARLDPFYGRAAMHTGMDLMGAYGGAVRATAGGIVAVAGSEGGYGQMVEIDHGNGLVTRYAHLSSIDVNVRDHVSTGTIVGRIGSTGRATGPHLHYETRINGEPVDPARFLKAGAVLSPS